MKKSPKKAKKEPQSKLRILAKALKSLGLSAALGLLIESLLWRASQRR